MQIKIIISYKQIIRRIYFLQNGYNVCKTYLFIAKFFTIKIFLLPLHL